MTKDERKRLRDLLANGTHRPWHGITIGWILRYASKSGSSCYDELPDDQNAPSQNDAELIAAAVDALPSLLACIDRYEATLKWYADIDNYDGDGTPFEEVTGPNGDRFYGDQDVGKRARNALGKDG